MTRQQQELVSRKKYTDAVRVEYNRLLNTQPQLEPEEVVRKLKVSVKVPKFYISPVDLEAIIREIVGKPAAASAVDDYMLPGVKRARKSVPSAPTQPDLDSFKETEITWHFKDCSERNDVLYGVEKLQSQLSRRLALFKSGFRSVGSCGMTTLITGDRGSGRTAVVRQLMSLGREKRYLEVSCSQVLACQKPAVALQGLRDFLLRARGQSLVCLFDDIDLLFPYKAAASSEKTESSKKSNAILQAFNECTSAATDSTTTWLIATAVSRVALDQDFLRHSVFGREVLRIPPLEADARKTIFREVLRKEAPIQGVAIEKLDLDATPFVNLTRGWTARQIIQTVALTISLAITSSAHQAIETSLNKLIATPETVSISSEEDGEDIRELETSLRQVECCDVVVVPPPVRLTGEHLESALQEAVATFAPEGFMDIPQVTMEDVGGLSAAKRLVNDYVIQIMKNIELHRSMGFEDSSGILMWGPPGCGKTHLAKAIANACQARFILVKGSELLDKYVGVSEQKVKELFERASDHAPCLIFFDEFDALCPARSQDGLHEVARRVVNAMLIELDGAQKRSGVFVIAATNEPTLIDEAIMRSGRFEHKLYIEPPDERSRADILQVLCRNKPWLIDSKTVTVIAAETRNCTGADLKFLLNAAALRAWEVNHKRSSTGRITIDLDSLRLSLSLLRKNVSLEKQPLE